MGKDKKEKSTLVFVKDPQHAWVPCTLVETKGDKATVSIPQYKDEQAIVCDGGRNAKGAEERVVKLKEYPHSVLPLQNLDGNNNMPEYADMVQLPYLHEVSHICFVPRRVPRPVISRVIDEILLTSWFLLLAFAFRLL